MISIVIPALNEEKFLPDCLNSLKQQTYRGESEIIVADNGSTDSTATIAERYGARVVTANTQKNVFYARQAGADAAHGDIIIQADADTIYPATWLQKIAERFAKNPEAAAVAGRFYYREKFTWAWLELFIRNILNILFSAFFGYPLLVSGATFAFRRDTFITAGGYRGLNYSADQYGIARRLRQYSKIIYDPRIKVITSPRSVRKPSLVLLFAVGVNALRLLRYWAGIVFTPRPIMRHARLRRGLAWGFTPLMVLAIVFTAYGYFVPASPVFGKIYYKGKTPEKVVAITFDDGPNEPYTSQILDVLKEDNIKATFFVIGQNVELYPDIARRILAEGNVLGNHSYSHNANHAITEYGSRDLIHAENTISDITGVQPNLYRPPHGKKTPWELESIKHEKMIEITWSDSANDQHKIAFIGKPTATQYAKAIVDNAYPGAIILLHDGYGTTHDTIKSDKSLTVQALPLIIEQLKTEGYGFVTVPELLNVPAYKGTD
jgi:peptidoglycan/xylan/chitin deacetylase (PgdA/CDA1 family)/GT2 family glycosyltransferase